MRKIIIAFLLLLAILTGCAAQKEQETDSSQSLEIIEVTIQTPETINPNEEITIQALVTQGSDKVDDANEVEFEIWKDGQEEHEKLKGQNDGKGIYSINKTFIESGKYYVISHVTARNMHAMPKKELTVGTLEADVSEGKEENHAEHEDGHGEHDASLEINMDLDQSFLANKEALLNSTIEYEGKPLLGANVKYEVIFHDDSNNVEWSETKEEGEGRYTALKTFTQKGTYHIQVHVNKDENHLHEHRVFMIDVK